MVRSGNTLTIYIDGVAAASRDCSGVSFNSSGSGLVIGRLATDLDSFYFDGEMDEVRVAKGLARWTADFTPPNSP